MRTLTTALATLTGFFVIGAVLYVLAFTVDIADAIHNSIGGTL